MALQNSGVISLSDIATEFGGSTPHSLSEYYAAASGVPSSGEIALDDFYGKSNIFTFSITSNVANGNLSTLATNAGWDGSAPIACTINSGVWCYATSTGSYGLLVNVANATITNYGKIIGMGGYGGMGHTSQNGQGGGHAMRVTVSGVTVTNASGAYIAGGGGGGGGRSYEGMYAGGGGGAGGGRGGYGYSSLGSGSGGGLNSSGSNGSESGTTGNYGRGGGAGGGGGYIWRYGNANYLGGGGGGRILPGVGGAGGDSDNYGGSGGNAGGTSGWSGGGGGGGWGASGGRGYSPSYGGGGGRAISRTTSITLSNSGTIYGAT
jgi:hypothetical protein